MASQTKKVNYDPAYCLQEHLNYFSENVASNLEKDFDLVFSPLAPINFQKTVGPPSRAALPVKHIYIEKVIILPKNFVFPGQATLQKPSVGPTTILPCPVTSDPLKNCTKKNNNTPRIAPSSPTCIKQQAQVQGHAIFEVPNPMLAVSAAEANKTKNENSLPLPVVSLVANPIPSSSSPPSQKQVSAEPKDQTPSTNPQTNPDTTTPKPPSVVAPSPVTVPCLATVAAAVTPDLAPVAAPSAPFKSPKIVPPTAPAPAPTSAPATPVVAPVVVHSSTISDNDEHSDEEPQSPTGGSKKRSAPKSGDVRRERNRKHAKKSRQRKKEFNQNLEDSINALKLENEYLRSKLDMTAGEVLLATKTKQAQSSTDSNAKETDDLLSALQNPENRVLGDDALASLQLLFKTS